MLAASLANLPLHAAASMSAGDSSIATTTAHVLLSAREHLRIAWRLAIILIMLASSRSKKASLAKLHILNDAVRSSQHARLKAALAATSPNLPWNIRVEPAFARAIDFAVGEKLANWGMVAGRTALQLTAKGVRAAEAVLREQDTLTEEAEVLSDLAKAMPENMVAALLGEGQVR